VIQAIRGTCDVLPADLGIWHALENRLRARKLRTAGKRVYLNFDARSLKSQMRLADKLGAKSVLIIGEEELKSGTVVLREMSTKEQRNIKEEDLQ
jgi:histidyl-tRNA synthetase